MPTCGAAAATTTTSVLRLKITRADDDVRHFPNSRPRPAQPRIHYLHALTQTCI